MSNGLTAAKPETPAAETRDEARTLVPAVDIFEYDDGLAVVADLPGVDKESLDVNVENDILTIKGKVKTEPRGAAILTEFTLADYFRKFHLSDQVDSGKIEANLKHGVLTLRLPKAERVKPKKVDVKILD